MRFDPFDDPRACRGCGCTDQRACLTPAGPCWWVEDDLCSACDVVEAAPMPSNLRTRLALAGAFVAAGLTVMLVLWGLGQAVGAASRALQGVA